MEKEFNFRKRKGQTFEEYVEKELDDARRLNIESEIVLKRAKPLFEDV